MEQQAEERLVWLLREEENEVVKITASAAVGNLLLEFSPMREVRRFLCPCSSVSSRLAGGAELIDLVGVYRFSLKLVAFLGCARWR